MCSTWNTGGAQRMVFHVEQLLLSYPARSLRGAFQDLQATFNALPLSNVCNGRIGVPRGTGVQSLDQSASKKGKSLSERKPPLLKSFANNLCLD